MVEKPEHVCPFQKIEEIKPFFGKVTEYKIKCELTVRKSSVVAIFIFHIGSTEYSECNPDKCPIYQTYLISSKQEDTI